MSQKDKYDEDEIIQSLVNENMPREEESFNHGWNGGKHITFQKEGCGCGCLDPKKFIINYILYTVVLMAASGFITGFYIDGIPAALEAGLRLTLLNTFVKPILVVFTFPLTVVTLGLFYFVINAIIITMTSNMMNERFVIANFWIALLAATFISILQYAIKKYIFKTNQQM